MVQWKNNRRQALRTGLALAATPVFAGIASGASAAFPDLRVLVTINGRKFEYSALKGKDLGDFTSEIGGFTQACYRVTHPDCPLIVFFRPDRDGSRNEVVFELGQLLNSQPQHLGAYNVVISDGTMELATIDVPKHFWFARWRWQSAPRPVIAEVKDLIARGLLPPLAVGAGASSVGVAPAAPSAPAKGLPGGGTVKLPEASGLTAKGAALGLGAQKASTSATGRGQEATYTIMGMAGLMARMGTTGERPDIGVVTEHQARFICTGAAEALTTLRAQAEAGGTCTWHMRDEKTGAPVDLDAYPTMSWYMGDVKEANPRVTIPECEIDLDSAHMPSLAYVPYLLTGDPYHLEDIQFACNWNRGGQPPNYRYVVIQTRAFAWSMRTLAQCVKATPDNVPAWLLPKKYWQKQMDVWRDIAMKRFAQNPAPECSIFKALEDPRLTRDEPKAPGGTHIPVWQTEFSNAVVGWMILMGFEDWKPFFKWQIESTIARTNGKSGWHRAYASPYRVIIRASNSSPFFTSWAEAWALTAKLWGWENDDPDKIIDTDLTYYTYSRANLVLAKKFGISGADECLTWLEGQLNSRAANIPFKWRFA